MEKAAAKHGPLPEPAADVPVDANVPRNRLPFHELFTNRLYLGRILLLVTMWFAGYVTV